MFFHGEDWLGGYGSWRRRMLRLGHISMIGTGLLNLAFALSVGHLPLNLVPQMASVLFVGRRKVVDEGMHSIPLVALGTGLLWFGWFGFNAGSALSSGANATLALVNTHVAAAAGAVVAEEPSPHTAVAPLHRVARR